MSTKRKGSLKVNLGPAVVQRSARAPVKQTIDEKNATVTTATRATPVNRKENAVIEISSASSSSSSDSDLDDDADDEPYQDAGGDQIGLQSPDDQSPEVPAAGRPSGSQGADRPSHLADLNQLPSPEGSAARAERDPDVATDGLESDAEQEPTIGELVGRQEAVDVAAEAAALDMELDVDNDYDDDDEKAVGTGAVVRTASALTSNSMSTVLNQALGTGDSELLEKCLGEVATQARVRDTIKRLDSKLAEKLLLHIAERVHKKPGRMGTLLGWARLTLILHGGFILAQPGVHKLVELLGVIRVRTACMSPMLGIKGRTDLLSGQAKEMKHMGSGAVATLASGADDESLIVAEGSLNEFRPRTAGQLLSGAQHSRKRKNPPPQEVPAVRLADADMPAKKRKRKRTKGQALVAAGDVAVDDDNMDVDNDDGVKGGDDDLLHAVGKVKAPPVPNGLEFGEDGDEQDFEGSDEEEEEEPASGLSGDEMEEAEAGSHNLNGTTRVGDNDMDDESAAEEDEDDESELEHAPPPRKTRRRR